MTELPRKVMTLVLVRQGSRVLLGLKKVRMGAGRWNGFGGKVEAGEAIESAAIREAREEAGIEVGTLQKVGIAEFHSPVRAFVVEIHIFETREFTGEPQESDEMRPQWFELDALPKDEMWKSDLQWWPEYLKGNKFTARFVFDKDDNVLEHEIHQVGSF